MIEKRPAMLFGTVIVLGSIWGLAETGLGMWLRTCASSYSGAIMTGTAFFFMAMAWALTRGVLGISLMVALASLFKLFDALFLSFPIKHGAIANPIFAFWMEGLAFLVVIGIFNERLRGKIAGRALFGGLSALLAVNLFPLVKFATGIPACVVPGTNYPLSLYYAPVAVLLSSLTIPLGFLFGEKLNAWASSWEPAVRWERLGYPISTSVFVACLAILGWIRH